MRKEIEEVPIKCRGIAAVLLKKIDNECNVLLLKRSSPILKEAWCYIGGSIEKGEKAWEAAKREIEEETGITQVALYTTNKFDQFYSSLEDYIYIAPVFVFVPCSCTSRDEAPGYRIDDMDFRFVA